MQLCATLLGVQCWKKHLPAGIAQQRPLLPGSLAPALTQESCLCTLSLGFTSSFRIQQEQVSAYLVGVHCSPQVLHPLVSFSR